MRLPGRSIRIARIRADGQFDIEPGAGHEDLRRFRFTHEFRARTADRHHLFIPCDHAEAYEISGWPSSSFVAKPMVTTCLRNDPMGIVTCHCPNINKDFQGFYSGDKTWRSSMFIPATYR